MAESESQPPLHNEIDAIPPEGASEGESAVPPAEPLLSSNVPPTPSNKNQTTACKPDQTPRWKMILEIAAVVVGGFVALVYWNQLKVMSGQLSEMRRATYVSCIDAQAAQQELLQIQRSAGDSHAATLAVVKQTDADIEGAKAILSINPKMPSPQDDLSIGNIAVHYFLRNEGKPSAMTVDFKVKAVLLSDNEPFRISTVKFDSSWGIFFGPGAEYPSKPTSPDEKTAPVFTVVTDSAGKAVDRNSPEAKVFFSGTGNEEVFFYGNINFTDFAGRHKLRFCYPVY